MRMTKLQGVLALCQAFPVVSHWIVKVLKEVDEDTEAHGSDMALLGRTASK